MAAMDGFILMVFDGDGSSVGQVNSSWLGIVVLYEAPWTAIYLMVNQKQTVNCDAHRHSSA